MKYDVTDSDGQHYLIEAERAVMTNDEVLFWEDQEVVAVFKRPCQFVPREEDEGEFLPER